MFRNANLALCDLVQSLPRAQQVSDHCALTTSVVVASSRQMDGVSIPNAFFTASQRRRPHCQI